MNIYKGSFRDLVVWRESKQLTLEIYRITSQFPKHELYGLTNQLRRSSSSVMANIAEGNYRNTNKDRLNFFIISRSSLAETDCYLDLAHDLKYLNDEDYQNLLDQLNKTAYLLIKLISSFF